MKTAAPATLSPATLAEINRRPGITREEYRGAILTLLPLAHSDLGGSKACALVLLSAYNSYVWRLPVTELRLLDWTYYDAAMRVIAGRVELGIEPHTLVDNGDALFSGLAREWAHENQLDADQ